MVRFDTAPRTMRHVALNRKHNAWPIDAFRDFRRGNTNDSSVPTFTSYHRHIRISRLPSRTLQFGNCQLDYLLLNFFSFLVASVEVLCKTTRLFLVLRAKEFNNCTCRIHPARCVDSW